MEVINHIGISNDATSVAKAMWHRLGHDIAIMNEEPGSCCDPFQGRIGGMSCFLSMGGTVASC